MDIRHGSPEQPEGNERSVEKMDDAPRLTEDDERALEAIRRQLDRQHPVSPRGGRAARRRSWDAGGNEEAERKRWNLARRTWIIVGTLLLACAVGGVVGAIGTILYFRNADHPVVADPQGAQPGLEALEPPSTAEAPIPSRSPSQPNESLTVADAPPGRAEAPPTSGLTGADVSPRRAEEPSTSPPRAVQAP
jgi:hypothetical protein